MKSSLFVVLALLLLPGCGAGGVEGGGTAPGILPPVPLVIETTSLPSGNTLAPYPATQIEVSGADGPVSYAVSAGALPTGLTLSSGGVLSGDPSEVNTFAFDIQATDGVDVATASYAVSVSDTFTLIVSGGLVGADAWSEAPVSLSAVGATGTVTFDVVNGNSGGSYTSTDAVAGTATWLPGNITGVTDELRATDSGSGQVQTVSFTVETNPAIDMVAEFGASDVWHVSTHVKRGTHDHRSDFLQALSDVGLLPAGSGSSTPTALESLVEATARVTLLRELNLIFLRDASGEIGSGLEISFPYATPDDALYSAPSEGGGQLSGGIARYSIMELADLGPSGPAGVLGRANYDVNNPRHDHDGGADPSSGTRVGTFTDRIRGSFASWQSSRLLTGDPVTSADESVVEDILYGRPSSGSRHDEIEELLVYFMRALAIVTAHEIGHSIGLDHTAGSGWLMSDSIGFSTSNLSTSNAVPLQSSEVTALGSLLPGAGRTSSLVSSKPTVLAPTIILEVAAARAP